MIPTDDLKFINPEIELSSDGSATLFVPGLNEHYHSVHGARSESEHVFINSGLKSIDSQQVKTLEIGMGTGLNVLLTAIHAHNKVIEYHTIEKYPLPESIFRQLNYASAEQEKKWLLQIHQSPWNEPVKIKEGFILKKIDSPIQDAIIDNDYNLVYFDAFAPEKQPEMWDSGIFQKIYDSMLPGGVLATYCAKGDVRRLLQSIGFMVERLPGPAFKRHITRAVKPA